MNIPLALDFTANALLRALPQGEIERLSPYLRMVPLVPGQRLSSPDEPLADMYFPTAGVVSRLAQLPSGDTVEAGMIGNAGAVGFPLALGGSRGIGVNRVQVGGESLAISAADFQEHVRERGSFLQDEMLLYADLQLQTITQLAACHGLHRIEQRLSRCILSLCDCMGSNGSVRVTHEALADFLGVHRPSVTYALQALSVAGIVGSERRRLVVRSREELKGRACECYRILGELNERTFQKIRRIEPR